MMSAEQDTIGSVNMSSWKELCGSHAANVVGVTGTSPQSLKRFDDWFLGFYPYLLYQSLAPLQCAE